LNHPNIIMVHEVLETRTAAAIVMELVSGVTLRAAAGTGPPLGDILNWSVQLANALAVAHNNGLVHGDIKPENVMVRDDGYVKLLDFGLAAALSDAPNNNAFLTGTPRYLSPEQCTGEAATRASDMFSFGVMLYELTTGCHPFESDDMLVLLKAIVSIHPSPPVYLNRRLPRALSALILRMLSKDSQDRPAAAETAEQLDVIRARLTRGPLIGKRAAALVFAALALAAAALVFVPRQPRAAVDLSRMNVRPIAAQPGLETNPSLSPDGVWISCLYKPRSNDRPQFQVHATRGGPPTVLDTGDLVVEESASWSPDSHDLVFVGRDRLGKRAIYRISRNGGAISKIAECLGAGCDFDWAPDGHSLALTDTPPGKKSDELFLVELAAGRSRRSLLQPTRWISNPRFSPDGKWIAFVRLTSYTSHDLCVLPSSGGPFHCVTRRPGSLAGFAWSTDSTSLIAMSGRQGDRPEMWQFPADGHSEPFHLAAFDFGRALELSISRRKGSIAWVRDMSTESIWRMPVSGVAQPAELLVSSAAIDADAEWSRQGRIAFRSNRSGSNEIWIARGDGSGQAQATRFRGPFVGDVHWSPDGRHLAFTCHSAGNADIFTVLCDSGGPEPCGTPKQLTQSPATDVNPTWSSDGRSIYFSSDRTGSFEVWKIDRDGGQPVRITGNGGYLARESADQKWLYYSKMAPGKGFWRLPMPLAEGGPKEEAVVPDTPFSAAATWALGPHVLYYYPSGEERPGRVPSV
ncbi:MAG: protein kinase, partial [Bryobacteraceae bacterium]